MLVDAVLLLMLLRVSLWPWAAAPASYLTPGFAGWTFVRVRTPGAFDPQVCKCFAVAAETEFAANCKPLPLPDPGRAWAAFEF